MICFVLPVKILSSVMHPGWISNQWTPGTEHFKGNPGSPTKPTNCVLSGSPQAGSPCLSIRDCGEAHNSFLFPKELTTSLRYLGNEMDRTWLLSVSSKMLETCGSYSWKWIPSWSKQWGKLQRRCQQGNKRRKVICEGTCGEYLCTQSSHTFG